LKHPFGDSVETLRHGTETSSENAMFVVRICGSVEYEKEEIETLKGD
jgi:hypothetical protein